MHGVQAEGQVPQVEGEFPMEWSLEDRAELQREHEQECPDPEPEVFLRLPWPAVPAGSQHGQILPWEWAVDTKAWFVWLAKEEDRGDEDADEDGIRNG